MAMEFEPDISALETEKRRLERLLAADERWLTLNSLNAADPGARAVLENALLANPCFVARQKIVEAISILGGAVTSQLPSSARRNIAEKIGTLVSHSETSTYAAEVPKAGAVSRPEPAILIETELTRVVGIDEALAQSLAHLGYTRCEEVANWTAPDVKRVSNALDLGKRISRENWIEQAALQAVLLPPRSARVAPAAAPAGAAADASAQPGPATDVGPSQSTTGFFSTYARPPLFDHRPQRIEPPYVARSPIAAPPVAEEPMPPFPVHLAQAPPPARAPPYSAPHSERMARLEEGQDTESMAFSFADPEPAPYQRTSDEADVVIVGSRTGPLPGEPAPPPIPADRTSQSSKKDRSVLPPLRRLVGAVKPHKIDATPYADDRGPAEEASVEIVRPRKF